MGLVHAAGEDGRVVPSGSLRLAREVACIPTSRLRFGVTAGVAEAGLPYGLAEDAGLGPEPLPA